MDRAPKEPKTAEWSDGEVTNTADVVTTGKTYADVKWRGNGRIQRIRYREPKGVTFKS